MLRRFQSAIKGVIRPDIEARAITERLNEETRKTRARLARMRCEDGFKIGENQETVWLSREEREQCCREAHSFVREESE